MLLSYSTIISYTINQLSWIIEHESIDNFFVLGNYNIRENTGRNKTFSIENNSSKDKGMNYFLKQPKFFSRENVSSIIREQGFYRTIEYSNSIKKNIGSHLPTFFDYNKKDIILILEWISNSINFRDYVKQSPKNPKYSQRELALKTGETLKLFHETLRINHDEFLSNKPLFFNVKPLSVFEIDFNILDFQQNFRPDLSVIIKAMNENRDANFKEIIQVSQKYWADEQTPTIINGDFKSGNILIKKLPKNNDFRIYLIDWEYSMWGSPAFDLATFYFYELVLNNFNPNSISNINALFNDLLEGYYGIDNDNQEIIDKITYYCKVRIIDYWCHKDLSDVKNEQDRNTKIKELKDALDLIGTLNITKPVYENP